MRITISGLDKTINHLKKYSERLSEKNKLFLEKLAQIGIDEATIRFSTAQYDGTNDVSVSATPEWVSDTTLRVYATGSTLFFIEFGTGVHYSEQHPKAGEFGFTRGGYGHHLGKLDSWRYEGDPGTNGEPDEKHPGYIKTHGNPPAMAMYGAAEKMKNQVLEIAREVFKHD